MTARSILLVEDNAGDVSTGAVASGIERLEQAAAKRTDLFTAAPDRDVSAGAGGRPRTRSR